ncbi:MAG: YbaY family lipoprotein [Pseudomonadota bacterium]
MRWAIWTLLAGLLIMPVDSDADEIRGEAFYRERIALPPEAVFEAVLEDASLADAPSVVLGRSSLDPAGQTPFSFAIPYEPDAITAGRRYGVRAEIRVGGELWFVTDTFNPVLDTGDGAADPLRIALRMVRGDAAQNALSLPASYRADLELSPGEPRAVQVDLWPDGIYHLRMELGEGDRVRDDIGRWRHEGEGLALRGGSEAPIFMIVPEPGKLRWLNPNHEPVAPDLVAEPLAPFMPELPVQGMASVEPDGGSFTTCLTSRSYALDGGDGFEDLSSALAGQAAKEVLVAVKGRLDPTEETLSVQRLIGVFPDHSCESGIADAALVGTYWKILRLRDEEIGVANEAREPSIRLMSDSTYAATVGCNQIIGSTEIDGEGLRFGAGPMTLMACPPPLDGWENGLREVLSATARWQVTGETLELFDEVGAPLALLRAVHF